MCGVQSMVQRWRPGNKLTGQENTRLKEPQFTDFISGKPQKNKRSQTRHIGKRTETCLQRYLLIEGKTMEGG